MTDEVHDEITRINPGNACYYSFKTLPSDFSFQISEEQYICT
jgi:hypothetical protein